MGKSTNQPQLKKIILASSNIDRIKCMMAARIKFTVIPNNFDESKIDHTDPLQKMKKITQTKAQIVKDLWNLELKNLEGDAIIIAAHTRVYFENELIGKPQNKQDAFEMLTRLAGHQHQLITCIVITDTASEQMIYHLDVLNVQIHSLTPEELYKYLDSTNEYLNRAGSYSINGQASLFINYIEGSPSNILGIPLPWIRKTLLDFGVDLFDYVVRESEEMEII